MRICRITISWILIGESGPGVTTERTNNPAREKATPGSAGGVQRPLMALSTGVEWAISGSGLRVIFFLGAILMATAGWLRPPLSPDVRGLYIPLGLWHSEGSSPEEIL